MRWARLEVAGRFSNECTGHGFAPHIGRGDRLLDFVHGLPRGAGDAYGRLRWLVEQHRRRADSLLS